MILYGSYWIKALHGSIVKQRVLFLVVKVIENRCACFTLFCLWRLRKYEPATCTLHGRILSKSIIYIREKESEFDNNNNKRPSFSEEALNYTTITFLGKEFCKHESSWNRKKTRVWVEKLIFKTKVLKHL